ncbi:MAG: hypothetical protein VXW65_09425 [Pseudomonadota bacterium]|nr:hypothetical protein [Pseudomonadota bacterium]
MSTVRKIRQGMAVVLGTAFLLSGCSQIYKTGANIGLRFTENHLVPPIVAMEDAQMVCESGTSLSPLIMSLQGLGADPTKLAVLLYAGSALCAEEQSLEHELRYLRAAKTGAIEEAQDARIAQKRWAEIASRRQYTAYQMFAEKWERDYKIKLGDQCPSMKTDFDQLIYMMGSITGLQAVINDIASGGAVNVPKDIAAVVDRSMECLDNEKFWGTPLSVRAAIWTLLPGASEGKPDPFRTMQDMTKMGERHGVRLPHAIYAIAAQATGEDERIRDALRAYGRSVDEKMAVNPKYQLLDGFGRVLVQGIADRYWTENTGTRTPDNGYTRFWDESAPVEDLGIDLDDLL